MNRPPEIYYPVPDLINDDRVRYFRESQFQIEEKSGQNNRYWDIPQLIDKCRKEKIEIHINVNPYLNGERNRLLENLEIDLKGIEKNHNTDILMLGPFDNSDITPYKYYSIKSE